MRGVWVSETLRSPVGAPKARPNPTGNPGLLTGESEGHDVTTVVGGRLVRGLRHALAVTMSRNAVGGPPSSGETIAAAAVF